MTSNECLQNLFMLIIKCIAQEGDECPSTEGARGPTRRRISYVGCSSSQRSWFLKREPTVHFSSQSGVAEKESIDVIFHQSFSDSKMVVYKTSRLEK